jgi:hypothetical protein
MKMKSANQFMVAMALIMMLGMCLPTNVLAACYQSNMTGTWFTYGVSGDTYYGAMTETDRCKIRINSTGTIIGKGSSCIWRDYVGTHTLNIAGGSLKVDKYCKVTGRVKFCDSGLCAYMRIQFARMARDKNTISMLGYLEVEPDLVAFYEAVKR